MRIAVYPDVVNSQRMMDLFGPETRGTSQKRAKTMIKFLLILINGALFINIVGLFFVFVFYFKKFEIFFGMFSNLFGILINPDHLATLILNIFF